MRILLWAVLACMCGCRPPPAPTTEPQAAPSHERGPYHWYATDIEVSSLPPRAMFLTLSTPIDLTEMLGRAGVSGAVDERSLRLYRLERDTPRFIPVQFMPSPQPRAARRALLPDTPDSVSYLGEYRAAQTPQEVRVAGNLAWTDRSTDESGRARYRLEFGVPREGIAVQVPYPPQDLRMFDAQGRATPDLFFPRMQIHPQRPLDGQVSLYAGNDLVTTYHLGPTEAGPSVLRRPFLYPLIGPDGIGLTEFGKPHDPTLSHAHHYSLWIAHASVNGDDFWTENGGSIVHEQLESEEDGPVFCRLVQRATWTVKSSPLLHERRTITLYRPLWVIRVIDIDIELTPASEDVTLGKTTFGFLAARVAQSMSVFDGGGEILNSRGDRNERGAHLKRADWIDQSGPIAQGIWNGIGLFDHPDNPNHPTVWHCRNDGWAGAAFNAEGSYTIKKGQTLRLRYRVLLHKGKAADARLDKGFEEYAAKPVVKINEIRQLP